MYLRGIYTYVNINIFPTCGEMMPLDFSCAQISIISLIELLTYTACWKIEIAYRFALQLYCSYNQVTSIGDFDIFIRADD